MEVDAKSQTPKPLAVTHAGFDLFRVWKEYEALAMHFNDLLMRLRSQSLAAVATFATAASVLLKTDAIGTDFSWGTLATVFGSLFVFWIAIWLLDFFYYNRLLLGAIDALEEIEKESKTASRVFQIELSTRIEKAIKRPRKRRRRSKGLWLFYGIVALLLFTAAGLSFWNFGGIEAGRRVMQGRPVEQQLGRPVEQQPVKPK